MNSTSMEAGSDDDDFPGYLSDSEEEEETKREDCHKHHRVDQHLPREWHSLKTLKYLKILMRTRKSLFL